MPHTVKTNKISIYLIKDTFTSYDPITQISDDTDISKISFPGVGNLYYKKSKANTPEWVDNFFNNNRKIDPNDFSNSNSMAVFITSIDYKGSNRFFAIPFGFGRFLLKDNCFDERFGLITTLNILDSKSIRGIDKRTLSTNPKLSREQISIASEATEFQIDTDKDLIESITGKSLDKEFGSTVTGRGPLSISTKVDITNIKDFLITCYEAYRKRTYKTNFGWIDKIKEVKERSLLDSLDNKLIKDIGNLSDFIWLAVPEIIEWSNITGFRYSVGSSSSLFSELDLQDFLNSFTTDDSLSLEDLKTKYITCWDASEEHFIHKWNVYSCLNAEVSYSSKKFFLINSKWYEIDKNFVDKTKKEFELISSSALRFPNFDNNCNEEQDYNIMAAQQLNALCLDRNLIIYGGGYSKIEFCDILTKNKEIIHVKPYSGSSALSHLFQQGHVSAELLLMDEEFRRKVIDKLTQGYMTLIPKTKPNTSEYKVIFAIIAKKANFDIPFFSKVSLNLHKKILEGYGYKVFLNKIRNVKTN